MKKNINIIYGIGGIDKSKPNDNIVETIEKDYIFPRLEKVNFLLELSERGLYKTLENNLNSLSEKERILFNHLEKIKIDGALSLRIKSILKVSDLVWEDIFIKAENQLS